MLQHIIEKMLYNLFACRLLCTKKRFIRPLEVMVIFIEALSEDIERCNRNCMEYH